MASTYGWVLVDQTKEGVSMNRRRLIACLAVLGVLLLAGCTAGTNPSIDVPDVDGKVAGFWTGLWHGLISCITFFISLFTDKVNIYELHNSGNWYDFGFILGVSIIFGGSSCGRRRWRKYR